MVHKEVKAIQTMVVQRVECDKCGKPDARAKTYDSFSFDFELRTGDHDGHGCEYNQRKVTMDLCQPCAEQLVRTLKANGYKLADSEDE